MKDEDDTAKFEIELTKTVVKQDSKGRDVTTLVITNKREIDATLDVAAQAIREEIIEHEEETKAAFDRRVLLAIADGLDRLGEAELVRALGMATRGLGRRRVQRALERLTKEKLITKAAGLIKRTPSGKRFVQDLRFKIVE